MNNPANQLANLLNWWCNSPVDDESAGLSIFMKGGTLLSAVESFVESESQSDLDLTFYRPEFHNWARIIAEVAQGRANANEVSSFIIALRGIGSLMQQQSYDPDIDLEALNDAASELAELVESDPELPKALRRYCFAVIHQVRREMEDHYNNKPFDIQACSDRLLAATNHLIVEYRDKKPSKLAVAKRIWEALVSANTFGRDTQAIASSASEAFAAITSNAG